MADLSTEYMGLKMNSPIIVGSYSLSKQIDNIKAAEDAGAGALVIKSLFEEQLQMEAFQLDQEMSRYENMISEALSFHPDMDHGGAVEHLHWMEETRKAVKMPIIASLNAISPGQWSEYAVKLEEAGADALELNLFGVITDKEVTSREVLKSMVASVKRVVNQTNIPIAVKMSPYFASPAFAAAAFDEAGADALVLFNRFAQPDIDIESEELKFSMVLSQAGEIGNILRWTGLLYGKLSADLCASTGIHDWQGVVKALLAGADAVQVVSCLMKHGIPYLKTLNEGLDKWMDNKGYANISEFRGKASHALGDNPYAYERAQYIKVLLGFD